MTYELQFTESELKAVIAGLEHLQLGAGFGAYMSINKQLTAIQELQEETAVPSASVD